MSDKKGLHTYLRILGYAKKYHLRFFLGLIASLFLAVFNGLSLATLKPIFDVIESGGNQPFQLRFEEKEIAAIVQAGKSTELFSMLKRHPQPQFFQKEQQWLEKSQVANTGVRYYDPWVLWIAEKKMAFNAFAMNIPPIKLLKYVGVLIIPIFILRLIFDFATVFFLTSTGLLTVTDIRKDLYRSMVRLPLGYFVKEKTGILMSRIINDVTTLSDATSMELRTSINNFFIIITHIIILLLISAKLLGVVVIGVPIVLIPISYFSGKIRGITRDEQSRLADLNGHLHEVIAGIRIIRAFAMEAYEDDRFEKINHNLFHQNFLYRITHQIGPALVELTTLFIVLGLIIYGGNLIIDGEMTSGSFFTFLFTLLMLLSPIKQMAGWYNLVHRSIAAGQRIFEIIDMPKEVREIENPTPLPKPIQSITFQKVSFRYSNTDKMVLKQISFHIPRGAIVAIVGHSGAGKSTLVDLLLRFYEPTAGRILFDNVDIRTCKIEELRKKIGMVTQDIFLFNGTIKENISYGRSDLPDERIIWAAKLAYAHDFIRTLPRGYETMVGERGFMLSGGQRQRLSIARALLKDPEILVLDEATSALDTHSERLVQRALEKLMLNRTTFVIAHRFSTICNANLILVMHKGAIVERGTHSELLKRRGHYKKLYDLQFKD